MASSYAFRLRCRLTIPEIPSLHTIHDYQIPWPRYMNACRNDPYQHPCRQSTAPAIAPYLRPCRQSYRSCYRTLPASMQAKLPLLLSHLTCVHAGNPGAGRSVGPRDPAPFEPLVVRTPRPAVSACAGMKHESVFWLNLAPFVTDPNGPRDV